mmetsp:Transcript_9237/g.18812  ORF Transcript_9237/g.18812 Transcript_9237/m.18812 type:complete len:136 (-) Transcript_9237:535-942(-)
MHCKDRAWNSLVIAGLCYPKNHWARRRRCATGMIGTGEFTHDARFFTSVFVRNTRRIHWERVDAAPAFSLDCGGASTSSGLAIEGAEEDVDTGGVDCSDCSSLRPSKVYPCWNALETVVTRSFRLYRSSVAGGLG